MTLPMARDLGKFKIRVTTIAPGIFETPMGSGMQKKVLDGLMNSTPLGRLGKASEFALVVEAMIVNSYVTGSVWRLDGGIRLPYL
jgi:3-hydroxyacyl-CoA dehydrogenase